VWGGLIMARESRKTKAADDSGWSLLRCDVDGSHCVVVAYVERRMLWEPIAQFPVTDNLLADVEELVKLVNERKDDADGRRAAFKALQAIEEEGFRFTTEQDLDDAIAGLMEGQG
jgi:hypothetical protein